MNKSKLVPSLGRVLLLSHLAAADGWAAVTVSVSPASITAGQDATVTAQATFTMNPSSQGVTCPLVIGFGDGSAAASTSCATTPCTLTAPHNYRTAGTYTITAEAAQCLGATGGVLTTSPLSAQTRLTVVQPPTPPTPPQPTPPSAPPAQPQATLTIVADPAIVRAQRDRGLDVPVVYRASGAGVTATLRSPNGSFDVGGATIATAPASIDLRVSGGSGMATETVRITPTILKDAASRGTGSLTYRRDFSGGGFSGSAAVTILVIKPAVEFGLERLELSFQNNRPEIVVGRDERGLEAHARLRFTGSGLLQARWEIDGRVLAPQVSRHVNLGDSVSLTSPELPTFDPGTHEVQLVIASPSPPLPVPTIVYLVRPGDAAPKALSIRLLSPAEGETLPYQPAVFRWQADAGAAVFLAQFYAADREAPVFSAWTRANEYRLPEMLYRDLFAAGGRYRWKVSAYNAEENLAGTSPAASFGFAP